MKAEQVVAALEHEWGEPSGFFFRLRQGDFDYTLFDRTLGLVRSIQLPENAKTLDRRLVALVWYIPLFMEWQRERVGDLHGNLVRFDDAVTSMRNAVEHLLGLP